MSEVKKKSIFYGWYVVAAGAFVVAISTGVISNCASQFVKPVCAGLGITRQQMSVNQTIMSVLKMVISFFWGSIYKRINLHRVMCVCAVLMPACYYCYSFANNIAAFYTVTVLVGITVYFINVTTLNFIIGNWFEKNRGTAIGFMSMGTGVGGAVMNTVISQMIIKHGFKATYRRLAILFVVIFIPCIWLIIREKPSDKGMLPYGAGEKLSDGKDRDASFEKGVSYKDAVRMPVFWVCVFSGITVSVAANVFNQTVSPNLSDHGYTVTFAAVIASISMVALALGKVALGKLYDKFGVKAASITACFATLVGLTGSTLCVHKVFLGAIIIGEGLGAAFAALCMPIIAQRVFGMKDYNAIYGKLASATGLGAALGPVIAGRVYDMNGSYDKIYVISIILCLISICLFGYFLPKRENEA